MSPNKNQLTRVWVGVSFLMAIILSIVVLPLEMRLWVPPIVLIIYLYWMVYTPISIGVWNSWFIGLFIGMIIGDPLGITAFLYALLSCLILRYKNYLVHLSGVSRLYWMYLPTLSFIIVNKLLLSVMGYSVQWQDIFKPIVGAVVVCPLFVIFLTWYKNKLQLTWSTTR